MRNFENLKYWDSPFLPVIGCALGQDNSQATISIYALVGPKALYIVHIADGLAKF